MIGYYVHHQGRGHLHRASAIIARLREPVVVFSSLPRPAGWPGDWIELERDDEAVETGSDDVTANGRLHWTPRHNTGLRTRMSRIAGWIAVADPAAFVVDLSVEIVVQARLCGVPVVSMVLPGHRDDDAHQLGFAMADALIAPWPALDEAMSSGLRDHRDRLHHVGGISRFDARTPTEARRSASPTRRALRLGGTGGDVADTAAGPCEDDWTWTERSARNWVPDPWTDLADADVVVTHCGLGALADTAAARRPAVLIPATRPHDEQVCSAAGLAAAGIGVVLQSEPSPEDWPAVLDEAARSDPQRWSLWSHGDGATRAAAVVHKVAGRR